MTVMQRARFLKALALAFGIELIAAAIWMLGTPYSSVPSPAGTVGWYLHAPGILLLLSVPFFSAAPDVLLFIAPPIISFVLWLFLLWLTLAIRDRLRDDSERKA